MTTKKLTLYTKPSDVQHRVKLKCMLAPTRFYICFTVMVKYAYCTQNNSIFFHTTLNSKLFNLSRLNAKTKLHRLYIQEILFGDYAAQVTPSELQLQTMIDNLNKVCWAFTLTISQQKIKVMAQGIIITIDNHSLDMVHEFMYLRTTVTDGITFDQELDWRIESAASTFTKLVQKVWLNGKMTRSTVIKVSINSRP